MSVAPGTGFDAAELHGELRYDHALARYTTWRVGGPAKVWYRPADAADLARLLQVLTPEEPLFWLGLGSNVLIRDGGLPGVVIATLGALSGMNLQTNGVLKVGAGTPCAHVARFSARQQLTGAEFLAGIPGTMGGALRMNAGAWEGETWRLVCAVDTIDRDGVIRMRQPGDFEIGYRYSRLLTPGDEWFVAAYLRLEPGDGAAAQARIGELLERRNRTQPTGSANCGSVFRNPPGDFAARLIEQSGLKGVAIGGAEVSRKHANFIVNDGSASAADLEALVERVEAIVARDHGVSLRREVQIVGTRSAATGSR